MVNLIKFNVSRVQCIEKIDSLNEELARLNQTSTCHTCARARIAEIKDELDKYSVMLNMYNNRLLMSNMECSSCNS